MRFFAIYFHILKIIKIVYYNNLKQMYCTYAIFFGGGEIVRNCDFFLTLEHNLRVLLYSKKIFTVADWQICYYFLKYVLCHLKLNSIFIYTFHQFKNIYMCKRIRISLLMHEDVIESDINIQYFDQLYCFTMNYIPNYEASNLFLFDSFILPTCVFVNKYKSVQNWHTLGHFFYLYT